MGDDGELNFFTQAAMKRPGGIRTFPMLALVGGMLYLFDPIHFIPFTGGLLVLGVWLSIFYSEHIRARDERGSRMSASWSWYSTFKPTYSARPL